MIRKIHIHNYRSILDLTVNLAYSEGKAPNGWVEGEVLPFVGDEFGASARTVPVLAIYGANASGKTNIIRAIHSFRRLVLHGLERTFHPNLLNRKYKTTSFSLEFIAAGKVYDYSLEFSEVEVVKEELRKLGGGNPIVVFSVGRGVFDVPCIETENYPRDKLMDYYRVECCRDTGAQKKTWLACLGKDYEALSAEVTAAYREIHDDLSVYLENDIDVLGALKRLSESRDFNSQEFAAAKVRVEDLMRKFDFGVQRLDIQTQTYDRKRIPELIESFGFGGGRYWHDTPDGVAVDIVKSVHKNSNGGPEALDFFKDESNGTKLMFGILAVCLRALDRGATVFFDELDRSLHPILLIELVKLFKLKKFNKHGAQLVFTAHDPSIMEDVLMRVGEIGIVNNNVHSGSTLTRLVDMKDKGHNVRNVHNFRKMYMEGFFAGVPYPVL